MQPGKRTKEEMGERTDGVQRLGGDFSLTKNPEYIKHRIAVFDQLSAKAAEELAALEKPPIKITLPNGTVKEGRAFETTPMDIAKGISKGLAKEVITARVRYSNRLSKPGQAEVVKALGPGEEHLGEVDDIFDINDPLEGDCELELIKFDEEVAESKEVFWHSSSHILGCALENAYGVHLTHGPPLESGFFYDFYMGEEVITPEKLKDVEKEVNKVIKRNDPFVKLVITREEALEMFKHNPFKVSFIKSKVPEGAATSVYRSGNLIDLCPGPHVPSTGRVKALKVIKSSATNWLGDIRNDRLQRVYGISFPTKDKLKEWVRIQEEIAKRDHRVVGEQQKLYAITKYSPGCPSFLPHGTVIYNKLTELIRKEYHSRGFHEINTPTMNLNTLWQTSGHYFKYRANMYAVHTDEGETMGIKPMNCPGHCAVFALEQKSYRELPWRVADFGVLHRNEVSGALSGLTRVRKFQQDDAHIFCTKEQIYDEIMMSLDFVDYIYGLFDFEYSLELSTRPELRVGKEEDWDIAEDSLRKALDQFGKPYTVGEGEGAFYGPKIDIKVSDCFKRKHQLGTIQLDFSLPDRFNLQYRADTLEDTADHLDDEALEAKIAEIKEHDLANEHEREVKMDQEHVEHEELHYEVSGKLKHGFRRPVMIHRAVLGSLERCIALLIENFGGLWPFFLSPRQVIVLPINKKAHDYANEVYHRLKFEGFEASIDLHSNNIKKSVKQARNEGYNYMLVVGEQESQNGTVNVRVRGQDKPLGTQTVEECIQMFRDLEPKPSQATLEIKKKAFYPAESQRLRELDQEITPRVFFDGEGLAFGAKDEQVLKELEGQTVCGKSYPNLRRWMDFVAKTQATA